MHLDQGLPKIFGCVLVSKRERERERERENRWRKILVIHRIHT